MSDVRRGLCAGLLALVLAVGAVRAQPVEEGIAPGNVAGLQVAFSVRTGNPFDHTVAPLPAGDLLLVLTPFPHALLALDAATGAERWRFVPEADGRAEGLACCGRGGGIAVEGDRVLLNTFDGRTVALDRRNGAVAWEARVADPGRGETFLSAPLAGGGRVVVGNAGDAYGARGWVAALDAATGRLLWRRYSTGPDAEVGIGAGFRPAHPPGSPDAGVRSWPPQAWQRGGGSVSGPVTPDPVTGLLIHGTGYPAPWNPDQRSGDNRWTSGVFARDAGSGEARWFTPMNPHDPTALGSATANLLLNRAWRDRPAGVVIHPDPNGYLYLLDRGDGAILSAEPYVRVTGMRGVDAATASPLREESKAVRGGAITRGLCPGRPGALGGAPALLEREGLLFLPVRRTCMDLEARWANAIPGTGFTGANVRLTPAEGAERGAVVAWNLDGGRAAWARGERFPLEGGVLALPSGLVLYGTVDGWLNALDAGTGGALWRFRMPSGILSAPVAYRGPDGRAYLAVLAGRGSGGATGREVDMRDATAANGSANLLRDLPEAEEPGGVLTVFRLP